MKFVSKEAFRLIGLSMMLSYSLIFIYIIFRAYFSPDHTFTFSIMHPTIMEGHLEFVLMIISLPYILFTADHFLNFVGKEVT